MPVKSCSDKPDVVVDGHPDDHGLVQFLADALTKGNMKVWFSSGSRRGENTNVNDLITKTKIYIPVLSTSSIGDDLTDRVAYAYVSRRAIYPVSKSSYRDLSDNIDGGMRLILSNIQWTFFLKEAHRIDNIDGLVQGIQEELDIAKNKPEGQEFEDQNNSYSLISGRNHLRSIKSNVPENTNDSETMEPDNNADFWQRHFPKASEVSITSFREKFNADYGETIETKLGKNEKKRFENLMIKDVFELQHVVRKEMYDNFICDTSLQGRDKFYDRLNTYVTANTAMKEVFDMKSTVRLPAIQRLAEFKTPAFIKHLKNLTADKDPNIQAVAALALAKTGMNSKEHENILLDMLKNKDRLVRESACLSLAHMKSERAIVPIVGLWRNDPIKHVREAAELALSRAGHDAAKEAMRITKVLTTEVAALKDMKPVEGKI